jgi:hypothetical protein
MLRMGVVDTRLGIQAQVPKGEFGGERTCLDYVLKQQVFCQEHTPLQL